MRFLIVNADDFGQSAGINRGIVAAHEQGIVTSTSLMVRGSAADEAAAYARSRLELSVGLHVDLGEWSWRQGSWVPEYEVVDTHDVVAVQHEVDRQVAAFRALVLRVPTHLDSHQHAHREEPVAGVLAKAATDLGVPLRGDGTVAYRGDFYGQGAHGEPYPEGITLAALERIIESLPDGWTELGCHPGEADNELRSVYRDERAVELAVLCDPRARDALARCAVELASFADPPRT